MEWTNDKPSVRGFYWMKAPGADAEVVLVSDLFESCGGGHMVAMWHGALMVDDVAGIPSCVEWAGPLIAPE